MASQKEIRVKIKSVQKTKKITSAMKLVAAAKVQKVQKQVQAGRPYSERVRDIFTNLKEAASQDLDLSKYPLLQSKDEIRTVLLLVFSSDRGLCGAYNTNVIKASTRRIEALKAEGKDVKLVTVGSKATSHFKKRTDAEHLESFCNLSAIPNPQEAQVIADYVIEKFVSGAVERVETISTKFISMVNSEVLNKQFLPVAVEESSEETDVKKATGDVLTEPDIDSVLNFLIPLYTENIIYHNLLESIASELAARMTAMSNATSNANNVIDKLTLAMNKARQASITQEISEIVGGAEALA